MAVILWAAALSLLMQCISCSSGQTDSGCLQWVQDGNNVCCKACRPGNRMVSACGPSPKNLCTPCEPNKFIVNPTDGSCKLCTQCVGAQVLVKKCTATTDTVCGCRDGLACGDAHCSFCVTKCGKGQEPTEERSCRPCPEGTFNNQTHQKCKSWSTRCPNPGQKIVAEGDALSDIKCADVSVRPVTRPEQPDQPEPAWPLVLSVGTSLFLVACSFILIIIVTMKIRQKRKKTKMTITKTPIIRTPTDDPRTLIAVECSFHEAQQEQGSSSESLASKDSSEQLLV